MILTLLFTRGEFSMTRVGDSFNNHNLYHVDSNKNDLSYTKTDFKNLMLKSSQKPENYLTELNEIFNSRILKSKFKNLVSPIKIGAFGAYWEGALIVLNTINQERDLKSQKADLELLKEDLEKLANFF